MGLFDFVKTGVQRMMIARHDSAKEAVVFKHPDQTFPFYSQVTVDTDEVCLFFKDGTYVGALGPGRHTLHTQNVPFLGTLIDKFTGGDMFISELFFVTTRALFNQAFGGPLGSMRDPELDLRVSPRVYGTYSYRVVEPVRFVTGFIGQSGARDPEAAMQWVRDQLVMGMKSTLTRMIKAGETTMMDLGSVGPEVARAVVQDCPDLTRIGVQVLEIAKLNINLSPEDEARIDEFQDQLVQAKVDARKARIGVSQAEALTQQRQLQLDQDFANRLRYAQGMDLGRYQQYAAAEATLGLGEGMRQGGGGAGAGLAGAGMMAGMGVGMGYAGMMAGAQALPGVAYPAGGYPAGGHGGPSQGVPGPFAAQPGYPPQAQAPQGYPAPGYPAPGYPAPGYPPGTYPGGGAPPQGYAHPGDAQPGYSQQGHSQQGHSQQGYPPPGYPPQGQAPPGPVSAVPVGAPQGGAAPPGSPGEGPPGAAAAAARPCGRCGAANPVGARFCSECGTRC